MKVDEIDWTAWKPGETATLCFVVRGGEILLIRKKRGLGAGKINGPGGRVDPGESVAQCAVRECQEEIGITPGGLFKAGELYFHFLDGYKLLCTAFRADSYTGELKETDEAAPFWQPVDGIPYGEMWADDAHWLPLLLARRTFKGYFVFDDDKMLDLRLDEQAL
ncbi:MAG: 8-oxo-dGTP diphosphatase [Elusimicrobiota bacterium]